MIRRNQAHRSIISRQTSKRKPSNYWSEPRNRRAFLIQIAENPARVEDTLYRVTRELIWKQGGLALIKWYGNSPSLAVQVEFPEVAWIPWHFTQSPRSWWTELCLLIRCGDHVARTIAEIYIREVGESMNIHRLEDWITNHQLSVSVFQHTFIDRFRELGTIPLEIFRAVYPYHNWDAAKNTNNALTSIIEPKVSTPSKKTWDNPYSRRQLFDSFITERNIESLYNFSWYSLPQDDRAVLTLYAGSPSLGILVEYPEIAWKPWKFRNTLKHWWRDLGSAFKAGDPVAYCITQLYIDDEAEAASILKPEDWSLHRARPNTYIHLQWLGGLVHVLRSLYPNTEFNFTGQQLPRSSTKRRHKMWMPTTTYKNLPATYWKQEANRREFMDYIKRQLGGTYEDLYNISNQTVISAGGRSLLNYYGQSAISAVIQLYPEYKWKRWKFSRLPPSWWRNVIRDIRNELNAAHQNLDQTSSKSSILVDYFTELATQLNVNSLEDWYHVRITQYPTLAFVLRQMGLDLSSALRLAYPHHNWDQNLFSYGALSMPKVQTQLRKTVAQVIPV